MALSVDRRTVVAIALIGIVLLMGPGPASAADPKPQTFVFVQGTEYDNLDPHAVFDQSRVASRLNLYDGLYRWQDNPPKLTPWLAESYTVSTDGLKYRFKLRRGVKFHDGAELTADDVAYSADRQLALKKGAASLFASLIEPASTKAIDRYTVEFTLSKPTAIFTAAVPVLYVVNKALVQKNEDKGDWGARWLSSNDAGSGSYALERFDPAIGFTAVRFKDHFLGWSHNPSPMERIDFRSVREVTSVVLGLLKGDFHGTDGYLPADQLDRLKRSDNVRVLEQETMRIYTFQMNNQRPPFNDVHVRRAISYAFDYEGFNNGVLKGTVARNPTPLPNNMWGVPKQVKGYTYDIEKAKAELAKAAVKVDRPLKIHIVAGNAQSEQSATLMKAGLEKIGITAQIVPEPWPTLTGRAQKAETTPDMWTLWISTLYADPHNWIGEGYSSKHWGTWKSSSWYKNDRVDDLLDLAVKSRDQGQRTKAYEEAATLIVNDAPSVWIYNTKEYGPFSKRVKGVRFCPVGSGQEVRWMSFE
ncbi:MAG: ABC transporter substrate-binding protein [Gemmatimonadota bacterium]